MIEAGPNIAVLGGGTGSFAVLSGLKEVTPNLSAIVNMSDDGGSTGLLREELGILPPGDARQCLVALSSSPELGEVFNFRFDQGSLAGHSLGNLILAGMDLKFGSFEKSIEVASRILDITGQVLPVSLDPSTLTLQDGSEVVSGESVICQAKVNNRDARVGLEPPVKINPRAEEAISAADLIVFAPGNLYGSLLPVLAVDGVAEAVRSSNAGKLMIANLVNKPRQTDGWHVMDYVDEFERYLGVGQIDTVLYNSDPPPADLIQKYATQGELPVDIDPARFTNTQVSAIGKSLLAGNVSVQDPADTLLQRTLLRHDSAALARSIEMVLTI